MYQNIHAKPAAYCLSSSINLGSNDLQFGLPKNDLPCQETRICNNERDVTKTISKHFDGEYAKRLPVCS